MVVSPLLGYPQTRLQQLLYRILERVILMTITSFLPSSDVAGRLIAVMRMTQKTCSATQLHRLGRASSDQDTGHSRVNPRKGAGPKRELRQFTERGWLQSVVSCQFERRSLFAGSGIGWQDVQAAGK